MYWVKMYIVKLPVIPKNLKATAMFLSKLNKLE